MNLAAPAQMVLNRLEGGVKLRLASRGAPAICPARSSAAAPPHPAPFPPGRWEPPRSAQGGRGKCPRGARVASTLTDPRRGTGNLCCGAKGQDGGGTPFHLHRHLDVYGGGETRGPLRRPGRGGEGGAGPQLRWAVRVAGL